MRLYRKMINHAIVEGLEPTDFAHLPTPPQAMEQINAVPADEFFALHELLDRRLGPGFALRIGQKMELDDYGVLGLSWKTCSWAGEIFARAGRYFQLLSNTYVFKIEESQNVAHVYLNRAAYRRGVQLSNEATLSATVVVLKAITESNISPVGISFQHPAPVNLADYSTTLGCTVSFGEPFNRISYRPTDLRRRTAKADRSINKFLLDRVAEETAGIEISPHEITREVEELIKDALPSGIPSISQISTHIGMSNRTLTRRLAENEQSFRDLIKKVQEEMAKNLLQDNNRGIADIAFETGFSEQSAFSRAFKRWTGKSPLEFRKNPW
ncbi:MAG: AraC family transcriptional regulator ligand-binding domain-containing protein [Bacteroidota bacterium]